MTLPAITYAEACQDPNLLGPWFAGDSWAAWRVVDKALFGEPLSAGELEIFRELTGRDTAPHETAKEAWFIFGRRSGKDVKAASICVYMATFGAEFHNYRAHLTPGERGVVQCLAVDRDQASVALNYMVAMFEQPMFAAMLGKEPTASGITLTNGLSIEVTTNDKRRVRGRTVVAAVFDEVAFWASDSTINPDVEVYRAVRPAMATIPGAMLIGISSPYAKRGLLYRKWKENWGKDGRTLVLRAPTWRMNPSLPRDGDFIRAEFDEDPASAKAEFGAEWRDDIEQYVSEDVVEACVVAGLRERAPIQGLRYLAFVDPSGGSQDAMTLAIGHAERRGDQYVAVLDAVREAMPPFSPDAVVKDFCDLLKQYRVTSVTGDNYAGEWAKEPFRKNGIAYQRAEKPRSDIYRDFLPLLTSGTAELLDNPKLVKQLLSLERRTSRTGRDIIDHGPHGHDDIINSVAGLLISVGTRQPMRISDEALALSATRTRFPQSSYQHIRSY